MRKKNHQVGLLYIYVVERVVQLITTVRSRRRAVVQAYFYNRSL